MKRLALGCLAMLALSGCYARQGTMLRTPQQWQQAITHAIDERQHLLRFCFNEAPPEPTTVTVLFYGYPDDSGSQILQASVYRPAGATPLPPAAAALSECVVNTLNNTLVIPGDDGNAVQATWRLTFDRGAPARITASPASASTSAAAEPPASAPTTPPTP
ncbi:hypothetical protein [Chondromyces crocatus]|uniref:Lipoprotein n=1 Tax=Chondromyces crocatus TaxID=52 RepID=A0A0K1EL08_CHOCO|nr:hypothetical protein [Chondromyces crocatus]AKT41342.1 uncharacterized protein CMC5_055410 [Chondromyces crocatus]